MDLLRRTKTPDQHPYLADNGPPHVYMLQSGTRGAVKIGNTKTIAKRIMDLQTGCDRRLYLRFWIPFAGVEGERALHEYFGEEIWREGTEWFSSDVIYRWWSMYTIIMENRR